MGIFRRRWKAHTGENINLPSRSRVMLKILGYPDRYSVPQGGEIKFMVSLEEGENFAARLVRVVNGDCNPDGPGLKFREISNPANNTYAGKRQSIDAGSCMVAPSLPPLGSFTFTAYVWPTLPDRGFQAIAAQGTLKIAMDGAALTLVAGNERHSVKARMLVRQWYAIKVSLDARTRKFTLEQNPLESHPLMNDAGKAAGRLVSLPAPSRGFYLAGCPLQDGTIGEHFDGKIEAPSFGAIARWDFSKDIETTKCLDLGRGKHHGRLVNLPARAMKGHDWDGSEHRWPLKPEHYGAIHFHHDDLYDAGWEPTVSVKIPADLKSGPYALHVKSGPSDETATREDYIPFFVVPRQGARRKKIAFLAPTCAYMAYANHAEHITAREAERTVGRLLQFGHADLYMYDHPELGGSLYDCHLDGSGVCYSSRLRPV
jgi:N,N-dimethylformamidase